MKLSPEWQPDDGKRNGGKWPGAGVLKGVSAVHLISLCHSYQSLTHEVRCRPRAANRFPARLKWALCEVNLAGRASRISLRRFEPKNSARRSRTEGFSAYGADASERIIYNVQLRRQQATTNFAMLMQFAENKIYILRQKFFAPRPSRDATHLKP